MGCSGLISGRLRASSSHFCVVKSSLQRWKSMTLRAIGLIEGKLPVNVSCVVEALSATERIQEIIFAHNWHAVLAWWVVTVVVERVELVYSIWIVGVYGNQRDSVGAPHPEGIRSSSEHDDRLTIHQHRWRCELVRAVIFLNTVVVYELPFLWDEVKAQNFLVEIVGFAVLLKVVAAKNEEVTVITRYPMPWWMKSNQDYRNILWKSMTMFTTSRAWYEAITAWILSN